MMAASGGIPVPVLVVSPDEDGNEEIILSLTSLDRGAECELTSNVSLEDTAISSEVSPLDIPTSQCSQLRCSLRQHELSDAGSVAKDPMWRVNKMTETGEECGYDIAIPDPVEEEFYRRVENSQSHTTFYPNKAVQIRQWLGAMSVPETVPAMFERIMKKSTDQRALVVPIVDDKPALKIARSWTYSEYYDDCILAAKGFIKYGLEVHHSVCILGRPSPTWHIANMAAIMAGAKSVSIDWHSSAETCLKIVNHCSADIIVVDKPHQLDKILKVISQMTCVKALIYCNGVIKEESLPSSVKCLEWKQLLTDSSLTDAKPLLSRMNKLNSGSCCTVIYTADIICPDGKLRGVMLSHDNITWSCKSFAAATEWELHQERVLSHMSLADINYQMMDIYAMIASGGCCYFVPDEETVMDTLANVHPTVFLGGSKQWESIQDLMQRFDKEEWKHKIRTQLSDDSELLDKTKLKLKCDTLEECVDRAFKHSILKAVGLEKCHLPLLMSNDMVSKSTRVFLQSLGLPLWEQYGIIETTGPLFIASSIDEYYMLSGGCYFGTKVRSTDKEILVNGRQVFMGYLHDYPSAGLAMDAIMCSVKTGVGGLSTNMYGGVTITAGVKDMIVLKCDKTVASVPLENAILKELPIAREAVVIGKGREYLTCLITLKTTVSDQGNLDPEVRTTLAKHECQATTLDDFDDQRKATIVNQLMKQALENIKRDHSNWLKRIALLRPLAEKPIPPHLERSKKREYVLDNYGSLIEELYQEPLMEKIEASVLRSP